MRRPAFLALLLPLPFAALPLIAVAVTHVTTDSPSPYVLDQTPVHDQRDADPRRAMDKARWNDAVSNVSEPDCGQSSYYEGT